MARAHVREPIYMKDPSTGNLKLGVGASVQVCQPGTTTPFVGNVWNASAGGSNVGSSLPALGSDGVAQFWLDTQQDVDLVVTLSGFTSLQYTVAALDTVDNSVGAVADNAVTTAKVLDGAITTPKLGPNAVTSAKVDATVEITAHKDAANGYMGLDANSHASLAELGSGTPSNSTYLRGDGTWAAGTAASIASAPDASISSPADGDLLVFHSSDGKWHNDKRPERTFAFFGGLLAGTLVSQTAAWTAARAWSDSVGGGTIVFGPGTWQHMPQMELGDHMSIVGQGIRATRLQFDASITSGACVFNHVSTNVATDPNAYACRVQSLTLDGSLLPGWGTNPVNGITFDRNPRFGAAAAADSAQLSGDAYHILRDVFIYTMPQDGAVVLSMGEQHWEKVAAKSCGRYGFQPPFDSLLVNCVADETVMEGFLATGAPLKLVGCKAFSCGNSVATRANGQGFHIKNVGQSEAVLIGCEAQDNWAAGFWVDNCSGPVALVGCLADSNSVRGVGTDPGFDISGSPHVQLKGCISVERRVDGTNSFQQNAVSLRIDSNAAHIDLTHSGDNGATVGSPFKAIGTGDVGIGSSVGFLAINNVQGVQTPAFAASFTPDFFAGGTVILGALTANATINAPSNGPYPKGARAEIVLQQNGTGGFTVTWNAVYKNTPTTVTTPNGYTAARFRFDGTSWVGI